MITKLKAFMGQSLTVGEAFYIWASKQPADRPYTYYNNRECPFALFLKESEGFSLPYVTTEYYWDSAVGSNYLEMDKSIDIAIRQSSSYKELALNLKKLPLNRL
jgi:hypothetical protein